MGDDRRLGMNDIYVEWLVERKPNPLGGVIKAGCYALTVLFFLAGIFILMPLSILGLAMLAVDYFLLPYLSVEYEYLYMQRSLSIDSIFSKEKRKNTAEFDLDKMELLAAEGSPALDSYKNIQGKTRDFSSGYTDRKRYIMVYQGNSGAEKVILEPDQKILDAVKMIYPSKTVL